MGRCNLNSHCVKITGEENFKLIHSSLNISHFTKQPIITTKAFAFQLIPRSYQYTNIQRSRPSALVEVKLIKVTSARRASINNQTNTKTGLLKFNFVEVTFKHVVRFSVLTSNATFQLSETYSNIVVEDVLTLAFQVRRDHWHGGGLQVLGQSSASDVLVRVEYGGGG